MKENLNKENFFNDMKKKYPEAMQKFCDFIDQYKKDNNWKELFNEGVSIMMPLPRPMRTSVGKTIDPKYHDLPIAMQVGIFIEFMRSISLPNVPIRLIEVLGKNWRLMIEDYLNELNNYLLKDTETSTSNETSVTGEERLLNPHGKSILISAIFKGENGSLGYQTGIKYSLIVYPTSNNVARHNGMGRCPYSSINKFFENWEMV